MKKVLTVVLSHLLTILITTSSLTISAKNIYLTDSTEIKKTNILLESVKRFGEKGKLDSMEICANQIFEKLEDSRCQNREEIKAEVYNVLATHGKYTKGNVYRIKHRKKALSLYRNIGDRNKYAYSILFLSRDFFEIKQIDSALYYLNKAEEYLLKDTLSLNLARCYTMRGNIKGQTGKAQEAITDYLQALHIIKRQKVSEQTSFQLSVIISNISGCYIQLEDYNNSLKFALKALKYSDVENFPIERKASTLTNLAVSYFQMGLFDKARLIYEDILERKESISNVNILISAYNNLASITDSVPEAMQYINESELIINKYKTDYYRAEMYNVKSMLLINAKQYAQAERYAHLAIKENLKTNDIIGVIKNQSQLLNILYLAKDYKKVLELGREFLPKAKTNGTWYDAAFICEIMIDAAVYFQDATLLYDAYLEEKEIQDTIDKINNARIFTELNTKYETEKKEQQIELLETKTDNQQLSIEKTEQEKTMLIAGLGLLILMFVPVGFYARQRNKNKVLEARINSENNECTRIAKELHDGVSGSLTTIRYLLETGTDSNKLVENIEAVSQEVRGVSHKLNMSALADQGMKEAVYDALMLNHFPENIELRINLPEDLEIKGFDVKVNFIRILQELVQNTIKYADASKIDINLKQSTKKIVLIYSDNGNGCELDEIKEGNGLGNIQDRVKFLNGTIHLDSQAGNGFYCQIEI